MKLKTLYITGNSFSEYPYEFLQSELRTRVNAEIINETISFKLRQNHMKKKKIPIIYENFVMIKDVQFKKKVNTEFFGVDIPVKTKSEDQLPDVPEDQPEEGQEIPEEPKQEDGIQHYADPFFITEAQKVDMDGQP